MCRWRVSVLTATALRSSAPADVKMPDLVLNNIALAVAGLIVVMGLFVYGLKDVLRLSPGRMWAIGGVCFRDAIRRKVLWVTPLAMLGVIVISLLQKPVDQPDAIRQTIKFCFFASALVVTIIALITAATNLPREIENRVIYTIVTKPVTRLEIVLGKIIGFSRVSAAMLLIMGIFTLGYLHMRAWYLGRQIVQTLQSPQLDPAQREWLTHFKDEGLLFSQTIHKPVWLAQYSSVPQLKETRLMILGGAQDAIVPFSIDSSILDEKKYPNAIYRLVFDVPYVPAPQQPPLPAGAPAPTPDLQALILDAQGESTVIRPEQLGKAQPPAADGSASPASGTIRLDQPNPSIEIPANIMSQIAQRGRVMVQILPSSSAFLYEIKDIPVTLQIITPSSTGQPTGQELIPTDRARTRGSLGRFGQQLRHAENGVEPLAILRFKDVSTPKASNGRVPFEVKVGVERSGADADTEDKTTLEITVHDRSQKKHFSDEPQLVNVENKRTAFFTVPAEWVQSPEFDVIVKNRSAGSIVGMTASSVQLVAGREMFGVNLFKGLFVLWLFSLLVAIVAFFCSTFLSWPIAVVLALLIILGRWASMNLELGSGFGAQVATEVAGSNPALARVVSGSVDALTGGFAIIASVLPDISGFGVTEQIERGATITLSQLASPLLVLVVFGIPLTVLAYIFLRNKEVAP